MLAKKILSNTFVQMLGRVVTALLAIVAVKLITRHLGTSGYGEYTTVYEFVGLFAIAGDLGLYTIAVREIADKEEDTQKIFSNVITMRMIFTAIVMLIVAGVGFLIPQYRGSMIPWGIVVCTVAVWLNLFQSIITSILQYRLKMHLATVALIAGKIVSVAAIIVAVLFIEDLSWGFYALVGAGILGHGVMSVFAVYFASKYIKIRLAFDFGYWKSLLKKSLPYGLALIFGTIYFKVDVTLLSLMRDKAEVGMYGVPVRMIEVLAVLPLFFMNSVLGTMTKAVKDAKEKLQRIFNLSLQFLLTVVIPLLIFVYLFSTEIVRLVSSEEFLGGGDLVGSDTLLILLMVALSFAFITTLFSFTLIAFGEQRRVLIVNAFGAGFNLVSNYFVIPIYGAVGAACTSIISEVMIMVFAFCLLRKVYSFSLEYSVIFRTCLVGVISFIILWWLLPYFAFLHVLLQILVLGLIGGGVYFGLLWLMRVVSVERFGELAMGNHEGK